MPKVNKVVKKKTKRKAPKVTKATALKIVKNPKTPAGLKAYWKNKLKTLK